MCLSFLVDFALVAVVDLLLCVCLFGDDWLLVFLFDWCCFYGLELGIKGVTLCWALCIAVFVCILY